MQINCKLLLGTATGGSSEGQTLEDFGNWATFSIRPIPGH